MKERNDSGGCAACAWVAKHGSTKLGAGHVGHTCGSFESPLQRSLKPSKLTSRARNVLVKLVEAEHMRRRKREADLSDLSEVELLRRASNVEPPITYDLLFKRTLHCGRLTSMEICVAMGLPTAMGHRAQCPRCGHVFGGGE